MHWRSEMPCALDKLVISAGCSWRAIKPGQTRAIKPSCATAALLSGLWNSINSRTHQQPSKARTGSEELACRSISLRGAALLSTTPALVSVPASPPSVLLRSFRLFFIACKPIMSSGRVYALLIATPTRHVVFERFYDTFTEPEKAEIRGAFDQLADTRSAEAVGRYK